MIKTGDYSLNSSYIIIIIIIIIALYDSKVTLIKHGLKLL